MKLRDKYGWPVELVIGRPALNFFRLLFLTDIGQTWNRRKQTSNVGEFM